jgi:flavin reductase (DIM6/NTAB) family NADH-FMN oxidoreductase RutF
MATATLVDGELAAVMEQMPYGVYIVGSRDAAGELNGMMADWVMQVSFKPRLVAVAFENDAHTLANIREHSWFTINMLPASEEGRHVAAGFLQPFDGSKVSGRTEVQKSLIHHKMDAAAHAVTAHGAPVLSSGVAWLECQAGQFVPSGDHTIVIGEVHSGQMVTPSDVLSSEYTGWTYSG